MNAYVPNKVGRRSVRKYGFVRFGEKEKGEKAIEGMNGKFVGGHKLDVAWAKFQKSPARTLGDQREGSQKKMVWQQIPKKKTMPNVASKDVQDEDIQVASKLKNYLIQDAATPYKQALLNCPNDNNLEAQISANEAVEEGVYEELLDNSKTITQRLNNAPSRANLC